jgi:hypothetical protein
MPGTPDSDDLHQRYDVIEKAYCQGRWSLVIEAGTILLRDLSAAGEEPPGAALYHRTQLLIAHTLLHGYGDRQAAEDVYEAVRQSGAEPSLRQIAEDGLDQCHQPLPSPLAEEDPEDEEDGAQPTRPQLFLPEEERSDLAGLEGNSDASKAAAGLSYQPRPQRAAVPFVPTPTPAESKADLRDEVEPVDLGLATDPFRPASGTLPMPVESSSGPVMPWLAAPPPAAGDAGSGDEEPEPPWQGPMKRGAPAGGLALVPDVVEEPELLEVHQASPTLAEEVDLVVKANAAGTASPSGALEGDPDRELRTGLLRVRID